EVEGEQEQKPLRQAELVARQRLDRRDLDREGDREHRLRRLRRDRSGDVVAAGPDLVYVVESPPERGREARHLPPPEADRVSARKEVRSDVVSELGQDVCV